MTSGQLTANIDPALERNRAFAAAGGHEGAIVFPNLRLFVITCLDPRVDPAHFLGLELSDAMVVRNVGGRVTPEVINDVAFIGQLAEGALPDGPLFEAAVIHHTQCGTGALADDEVPPPLRRADRRRRINPARPRGPRPGLDRRRRRRAPPLRARDLSASQSLGARLRRGHGPGRDRRPRRPLTRSAADRPPGAHHVGHQDDRVSRLDLLGQPVAQRLQVHLVRGGDALREDRGGQ